MCTPAKRLARVSWSARATARPPTPRAVSSGAMDTPMVSRATRAPIARTTIRVMLTKMVADPATPVREFASDWTSPATTRAAPSVASRISSAVREWFTNPAVRAVRGRAAVATAAPAMRAAPGARVRRASTMRSSPLQRVRSACLPSQRRRARTSSPPRAPAASAMPAISQSWTTRSRVTGGPPLRGGPGWRRRAPSAGVSGVSGVSSTCHLSVRRVCRPVRMRMYAFRTGCHPAPWPVRAPQAGRPSAPARTDPRIGRSIRSVVPDP